jgi:AcrR family transcriptional regulator
MTGMSPRQKPGPETQGREWDIVTVASRHLNTMGVSVEWFGEIASELRISRPALYNYVVDRDDLLFRCYLRSCEALELILKKVTAASRDPVHVLDAFLSAVSSPDAPETAVLSEIEALPPDRQVVIRGRRDALIAWLASIVGKGIAEGVFRPLDTTIVANTVLGMADWERLYRRWAANAVFPPSAAGAKAILFHGLAAHPDAPYARPACFIRPAPGRIDVFDRRAMDGARREAILVAASALFNRRGIGATRVEDVGAAVGLSKRAIYHHIGHKDALVDACVERAIAFYLDVMDAAGTLPASRLEAYVASVRDIIETFCDPERTVLVPYVGSGLLSGHAQGAMADFTQRLRAGYRKILVDGQREGSIRAMPLDEVLSGLPGVFSWAANSSVEVGGSIADELAALIARGILAGAPAVPAPRSERGLTAL